MKLTQTLKKVASTVTISLMSFAALATDSTPTVVLETNKGNITIELNPEKAPQTVENFLGYVNDGFYNGVIFHRVIPNFMIQTGGFTQSVVRKATKQPITNEAKNGLSNTRGTIAMARTSAINSATSQFFINNTDNLFLDHKGNHPRTFGYAVFGKVTDESLSVVDAISAEQTTPKAGHQNMPINTIIIEKAYQVKSQETAAAL